MARVTRSNSAGNSDVASGESITSGNAESSFVDLGEIDATTDEGRNDGNYKSEPATGEKRGRGRPPGSGAKSGASTAKKFGAAKARPITANTIEFALTGIHACMVSFAGEHWKLTEQEASYEAAAAEAYFRHFSPEMSEKAQDLMNFIFAVTIVEGPRIVTSFKNATTPKPKHAPASIIPLHVVETAATQNQPAQKQPSRSTGGLRDPLMRPASDKDLELLDELPINFGMQSQ